MIRLQLVFDAIGTLALLAGVFFTLLSLQLQRKV